MSLNLVERLMCTYSFKNKINLQEINDLCFILQYCMRHMLHDEEEEYILELIRTSKVYTMDMINILLHISENIKSSQENKLFELIAICSQNICNFDINNVTCIYNHSSSGNTIRISRIIEIIITFTEIHVDENVINYLRTDCNIHVQEPERFY